MSDYLRRSSNYFDNTITGYYPYATLGPFKKPQRSKTMMSAEELLTHALENPSLLEVKDRFRFKEKLSTYTVIDISAKSTKGNDGKYGDDNTYAQNKKVWENVPRGCVIVKIEDTDGTIWYEHALLANRKFTGHEDDESCSASLYSLKDEEDIAYEANTVCITLKGNGCVFHVSVKKHGKHKRVYFGSKKVHCSLPADVFADEETLDKALEELSNNTTQPFSLPVQMMQAVRHQMTPEFIDWLAENQYVVNGEYLVPHGPGPISNHELEQPIVRFFSVTHNFPTDELCVSPLQAFRMLASFGLNTMPYKLVSISELAKEKSKVMNLQGIEGAVLYYLLDGRVIQLEKVKTAWYFIVRAIREKMKHLLNKKFESKLLKFLRPLTLLAFSEKDGNIYVKYEGANWQGGLLRRLGFRMESNDKWLLPSTVTETEVRDKYTQHAFRALEKIINDILKRIDQINHVPVSAQDKETWKLLATAFIRHVFMHGTGTVEERQAKWREMLAVYSDTFFSFYTSYVKEKKIKFTGCEMEVPAPDHTQTWEQLQIFLLGCPGLGKTTISKILEQLFPKDCKGVNQDSFVKGKSKGKGAKKKFLEALKTAAGLITVVDKCNHNQQTRQEARMVLAENGKIGLPVYVIFGVFLESGELDVEATKTLAHERIKVRGQAHHTLQGDNPQLKRIIHNFTVSWHQPLTEQERDGAIVINLDTRRSVEEQISTLVHTLADYLPFKPTDMQIKEAVANVLREEEQWRLRVGPSSLEKLDNALADLKKWQVEQKDESRPVSEDALYIAGKVLDADYDTILALPKVKKFIEERKAEGHVPNEGLHVTLQFRGNRTLKGNALETWTKLARQAEKGKIVKVHIVSLCYDKGIAAFACDILDDDVYCQNQWPHMTCIRHKSVRPVGSNNMLSGEHKSIPVGLTIECNLTPFY